MRTPPRKPRGSFGGVARIIVMVDAQQAEVEKANLDRSGVFGDSTGQGVDMPRLVDDGIGGAIGSTLKYVV